MELKNISKFEYRMLLVVLNNILILTRKSHVLIREVVNPSWIMFQSMKSQTPILKKFYDTSFLWSSIHNFRFTSREVTLSSI